TGAEVHDLGNGRALFVIANRADTFEFGWFDRGYGEQADDKTRRKLRCERNLDARAEADRVAQRVRNAIRERFLNRYGKRDLREFGEAGHCGYAVAQSRGCAASRNCCETARPRNRATITTPAPPSPSSCPPTLLFSRRDCEGDTRGDTSASPSRRCTRATARARR